MQVFFNIILLIFGLFTLLKFQFACLQENAPDGNIQKEKK